MTGGFFIGRSLDQNIMQSGSLMAVRRSQLRSGDAILVRTSNSLYTIRVLKPDIFAVTGGWFDRKGTDVSKIGITGCTWGGSAIKRDIVAACGLCIEFGNRVTTSMVRQISIIPYELAN